MFHWRTGRQLLVHLANTSASHFDSCSDGNQKVVSQIQFDAPVYHHRALRKKLMKFLVSNDLFQDEFGKPQGVISGYWRLICQFHICRRRTWWAKLWRWKTLIWLSTCVHKAKARAINLLYFGRRWRHNLVNQLRCTNDVMAKDDITYTWLRQFRLEIWLKKQLKCAMENMCHQNSGYESSFVPKIFVLKLLLSIDLSSQ